MSDRPTTTQVHLSPPEPQLSKHIVYSYCYSESITLDTYNIVKGDQGREINYCSRALRPSFLGLPVVVARAHSFIPIIPWGNAEALLAALLTEEHAWLMVLGLATPPRAL